MISASGSETNDIQDEKSHFAQLPTTYYKRVNDALFSNPCSKGTIKFKVPKDDVFCLQQKRRDESKAASSVKPYVGFDRTCYYSQLLKGGCC